MSTSQGGQDSNTATYELLFSNAEQPSSPITDTHMVIEEEKEGRAGDVVTRQVALIAASTLLFTTWTITLMNNPSSMGWFALHPPLQTLALFSFTFGIITLQPTNQPKTKAAGLLRHQILMFLFGFPVILFGTFAVFYNKMLRGANHFTTWHGTFGILCIVWLVLQIFLGVGSVWYGGALFGGGMKAKLLWKYHRLSGYILFPFLLFTAHLGGAWSAWGAKYSLWIIRFVAYTVAPLGIFIGVYSRIRTFKMKFFQ